MSQKIKAKTTTKKQRKNEREREGGRKDIQFSILRCKKLNDEARMSNRQKALDNKICATYEIKNGGLS